LVFCREDGRTYRPTWVSQRSCHHSVTTVDATPVLAGHAPERMQVKP
jgi:hypothetical protein